MLIKQLSHVIQHKNNRAPKSKISLQYVSKDNVFNEHPNLNLPFNCNM